jgi:hypothetical protein
MADSELSMSICCLSKSPVTESSQFERESHCLHRGGAAMANVPLTVSVPGTSTTEHNEKTDRLAKEANDDIWRRDEDSGFPLAPGQTSLRLHRTIVFVHHFNDLSVLH